RHEGRALGLRAPLRAEPAGGAPGGLAAPRGVRHPRVLAGGACSRSARLGAALPGEHDPLAAGLVDRLHRPATPDEPALPAAMQRPAAWPHATTRAGRSLRRPPVTSWGYFRLQR